MKVITIGKRLVSVDQVAFVEPFDPAANPAFKPEKEFKGRVVLLDRDMLLTEQTPREFAEEKQTETPLPEAAKVFSLKTSLEMKATPDHHAADVRKPDQRGRSGDAADTKL